MKRSVLWVYLVCVVLGLSACCGSDAEVPSQSSVVEHAQEVFRHEGSGLTFPFGEVDKDFQLAKGQDQPRRDHSIPAWAQDARAKEAQQARAKKKENVGGWVRHKVSVHEGDELQVEYRNKDTAVTVRTFPRVQSKGAPVQTLAQRFALAKDRVFWADSKVPVSESPVKLGAKASPREGLSAHQVRSSESFATTTRLALFVSGDWFVQYRATSQGALSQAQDEAFVSLVETIHTPLVTP